MKSWVWLVVAAGMGMTDAGADVRPAAEGVAFLSDYRGSGYLLHFLNRRGEFQKDRFVTEGAVELDFSLAAWSAGPDLRTRFTLTTGMGRSVADNLPFSPKEMAYEINPFLEWRTGRHRYAVGLQHACQHLIYKDYENPWYLREGVEVPPDVYYNRIYAGAGSRAARPEELVTTWLGPDALPDKPRWLWQAEAGGYVRSLGGLWDSEALYGDNDWAADLKLDAMLPLLAWPRWAVFGASRTHLLLDTNARAVWRSRLELEVFFARRGFGSSAFLSWNAVDEHPRDSREGLLELGARFFF